MSTDRPTPAPAAASVLRARTAVGSVFFGNGLIFSSLVARVPDIRSGLELDNGALGLLLLSIAVGSLVALPTSGRLIDRWSASAVVRWGAVVGAAGLVAATIGVVSGSVPLTAAGMVVLGGGSGAWDVAMNVEGAEVERRLGRTIMPRFHAGFSLGTVAGAGLAVLVIAAGVPLAWHLLSVAVITAAAVVRVAFGFLPVEVAHDDGTAPAVRSAWLEPRTLAVGLLVLAFAVAEGSANDWLALALVDGHETSKALGVAGYTVFVSAMTVGRLAGTVVLDRWGRARVLWTTTALVALGLVLLIHTDVPVLVGLGIVLWGLGTSLGFPVGMSAAADDPARAAARVSVVSTIGYGAFLAGPPLLGALGDRIGTLESLQVVGLLMLPAAVAVLAARPRPVPCSAEVGPDAGGAGRL